MQDAALIAAIVSMVHYRMRCYFQGTSLAGLLVGQVLSNAVTGKVISHFLVTRHNKAI
jgi:hypothetical protein